jgi:hypothetical protein
MTSKLVIASNPPKVEAKCNELKIKKRKHEWELNWVVKYW